MDETEMAKRMAAVHRMAVTMAKTDGLISAKILSVSEFQGNPISEEALDSKNPVGKQSDGGRYFIHVRQDGRGQIMIHWPNGIEKTIKFLIPDDTMVDRVIEPASASLIRIEAGSVTGVEPEPKDPREGICIIPKSPINVRRLLLGMAVFCVVLARVRFSAIWPFELARWAICSGSIWCSYHSKGWRRFTLGMLAVIYNPIQPIHFDRIWDTVNWISSFAFIAASILDYPAIPQGIRRGWVKADRIIERAAIWSVIATVVVVPLWLLWAYWQASIVPSGKIKPLSRDLPIQSMNDIPTPFGLLTDEDAAALRASGGPAAAPPHLRDFYTAHLNQYDAFRVSAPRQVDLREKARKEKILENLTLDFDQTIAGMDLQVLKLASDPESRAKVSAAITVDAYIQTRTGPLAFAYKDATRDMMRDAVAVSTFGEGKGTGSDEAFMAEAKAWQTKRRERILKHPNPSSNAID